MNVTFFPTGTGNAESAVNYLLGDLDHEKKVRSVKPELLYGDPLSFQTIANGISRKHKYTSGVIALRDTEHLDEDQIKELIESFRETFLPGLKVDENFTDLWVAHRDKGNLELHFLYANTEIQTGRQLVIHPPGQKNLDFYNAFVCVNNHKHGFAQVVPDPLKISLADFEAKSPNGEDRKTRKKSLADTLHSEILIGNIQNRNQLIGYLKKQHIDVTRVGSNYLTVVLPGTDKPCRLKGELFKKDGDYSQLVQQHYQSKIPKYLTEQEAQAKQTILSQFISERTGFNYKRFLASKPKTPFKVLSAQAVEQVAYDKAHHHPKDHTTSSLAHVWKLLDDMKSEHQEQTPQAPVGKPGDSSPSQDTTPSDSNMPVGDASAGLLEQIGSLNFLVHSLKLELARSGHKRAAELQAKITALLHKLEQLNLELEKRRKNINSSHV